MSDALVNGGVVPAFIDDDDRTRAGTQGGGAQNGQEASAILPAKEIALVNQLAHAGRPVYSWQQQDDAFPSLPSIANTSCYRQVYMASNKGAASESGTILGLQPDPGEGSGDPGFQTGQGFHITIGGTEYPTPWGTASSEASFPVDIGVLSLISTFGYSAVPVEAVIGGRTINWPQPRAGSFWQDPTNLIPTSQASFAGGSFVHQKGDIVGTLAAGQDDLPAFTDVVRDTWFRQRPQCGWSTVLPGQPDVPNASKRRGVHFSTSSQNYRYIFDQSYGAGGGTVFSAGGQAMTLPLANAAGGRRTQVRVYVFVYAAMSGATNTGSIGVANKGSTGTMATSASTLTNGPTISGATFQWYPTLATWSPTTAPYFLGYTGSAYDRVALCARSSGATDQVIVGAFTFVVAPSTT